MAVWNQIMFQDSVSWVSAVLSAFHDFSLSFIMMILFFVGGATYLVISNSFIASGSLDRSAEIIWTVVPAFILVLLAVPSLWVLYIMETGFENPGVVVKVTGHQWYWNYGIMDKDFSSYMVNSSSGSSNMNYRLLDVDNRLILPVSKVKFLVSSEDVIHSWAVPSLGLKVDAIPGRLNSLSSPVFRSSVMYGQCSEICGVNHSFMPIVVESISVVSFKKWLFDFLMF